MVKSITAVVVGFLLIGALSFGTDALLHNLLPEAYDATGRVTSMPLLLFSLLYVAVYAVGGCYLTARLAPSRPMLHALILGGLGLVFNVMGSIAVWDTVPVWYHAVGLSTTLPYAWFGGRLREAQLGIGGARVGAQPALR